ncbi:MAG: YybS family protein [Desulfobacteraceae bacterium]|nr:YybS family protein [Desulfobacteraceae bacterium]
MPQAINTELLRDIVTGTAITCCIVAVSLMMPIAGFFISLLIPLPVLFYRAKLGRKNGIIIPVLTAGILTVTVGRLSLDVFFLLEMMVLGLILFELFEKELSIEKTVGYTCIAIVGISLAAMLVYSGYTNIGLIDLVTRYVVKNLELTISWYENIGVSDEQISIIKQSFNGLQFFLVRILPALIFVSALFVTWTNMVISRPVLKAKSLFYPDFGSLNQWKSPEKLIWGVIGTGFLLLIGGSSIKMIGMNGLFILLAVYFFHGIAVVSFFFEKKNIPRIVRIILYAFLAVQQILWLFVIGLGLFDLWLDFRKLNPPEIENKNPK